MCEFYLLFRVVKAVAQWISRIHPVRESWVPFVTGAAFVLPLILFTWLLNRILPPSIEDRAQRVSRVQRGSFWNKYAPGLLLLLVVYVILTFLRDFSG